MNHVQIQPGESDPLALLDFSSLLDSAARLRPGRIAFHDIGGGGARALTFAGLDQRTHAMAQAWRELGLQAGERLALVGSASTGCIVALFGALRAGIDVALAPPHMSGAELAQFTIAMGAAALCGEAQCGDINIGEAMFEAAAAAERVRLVACIGTASLDGAVALDPFLFDVRRTPTPGLLDHAAHARVITRDETGHFLFHRQRTLVAAALDFITHAPIGTQTPLISTIMPASFAGLVAGPMAALAAGAPLVLHGPFDSKRLLQDVTALRPVHLVAPASIGADIAASALVEDGGLASLILMSRQEQLPDHPAQSGGLDLTIPVIDLYAVGEIAAIAEPRWMDGTCPSPLALQHMLNLDGRDIVAARRKARHDTAQVTSSRDDATLGDSMLGVSTTGKAAGAATIEGAAVSGSGDSDHE